MADTAAAKTAEGSDEDQKRESKGHEMGSEKSLHTTSRKASLIQRVVDMSKSGSEELESADSQFLMDVESELQEVCDALSILCKASFHSDDEDAEQLLLRGTLALPYYYGGTSHKVFTYWSGINIPQK